MTNIGMISVADPISVLSRGTTGVSSVADAAPAFSALLQANVDGAASPPDAGIAALPVPAPYRPEVDAVVLHLLASLTTAVSSTSRASRPTPAAPGQGVLVQVCAPAGDDCACGDHAVGATCEGGKHHVGPTDGLHCRLSVHRDHCPEGWNDPAKAGCGLQAMVAPLALTTNTYVWLPVVIVRLPIASANHRIRRQKAPRKRSDHHLQAQPDDADAAD